SPRYRRSAEMVRDNALAVSGLLQKIVGGRSVFPYQPNGLWREISNKFYFKEYEIDPENGLYRRSIYTFWKRNLPPPSMIIFDANRRNECNVRRRQTNTPLQALVMLNDPQIIEACRVLAGRIILEDPKPENAVALAFRKLTGRIPSQAEKSILLEQYLAEKAHFQNDPKTTQEYLSTGFYPQDVSLRSEEKSSLAALTVVSHTIMNSTEGYYKN
ncbi:MAG: DUF1553 domain-containing protein, partial [Bacteroidetes bacterium]|nr:DUF1553 domain-containing protein [Bacteroidota bacterium]